jgi:putative intracellular protease/amidase
VTAIVIVLTEGFADWETTLLGGVARQFYGIDVRYAAPGGKPVTSSGGMRVVPDLALEGVKAIDFDAIVVSGGTIWQTPGAPDLTNLLQSAKTAGRIIGLICDGTVAGARTGLLDTVAHTSNGVGYLDATGYQGKVHYRDVPHAVSDQGVITATASAPVSFMHEVMRALGQSDANLDYYVGMHAAQHEKAA